jgi:multiple sugar transport system substrate-binding protein
MKRFATACVLLAATLPLAGCFGGGGSDKSNNASASTSASASKPVTITAWVGWSAATHELKEFKRLVAEYDAKHPEVTVKVVGDIVDDKITAAIRSGNVPDVVSTFTSSNVGTFCPTGAWVDLAPYLTRDHIDMGSFTKTPLYYTQYKGTRCALPLLADTFGLYYNKDMFAKAGITRPPRTMSELTVDAKKLTQKNADGSLKVVGFDPASGFYDGAPNKVLRFGSLFGGKYSDAQGNSILATDPAWAKELTWQKNLVDWYGYGKLVRFQAGLGDEFSASNAFEKGKLAMNEDGEWRVAFIKNEHPELNYATAPMPVDDAHPELYGSGHVNGTIIGIPKGVNHPDQAWNLVKYLTTNTHFLAEFSNAIRNVPTTLVSAKSPEIQPDPHFAPFLKIIANPKSNTAPITEAGAAYQQLIQDFALKWQAGHVSDLHAGLVNLDKQIDAQLKQAKQGGAP